MDRVKVGVIGAGFQADVHCASIQIMPEAAEVVAVASPTPGHARAWRIAMASPAAFSTTGRC